MIDKKMMTEAMDAIATHGSFRTDSNALAQRVEERIRERGGYAISGTYTEVYYDPTDEMDGGPYTCGMAWVSTRGEDTQMGGTYRSYADGTDECPIKHSIITGDPDWDGVDVSQLEDEWWMTDEELDARERCECGSVL